MVPLLLPPLLLLAAARIKKRYPFCDTTQPLEARVDNLISLIADDEIKLFMKAREGGGGSPGPANNISRLGLPEYDWGVNCIHGGAFLRACARVLFYCILCIYGVTSACMHGVARYAGVTHALSPPPQPPMQSAST